MKSCDSRFHQRCCGSHRQKIMHLLHSVNDFRRCDHISQTPACDGIGFGKRVTYNCPLPHSRKSCKIDMFMWLINNVLINLIRDYISVIFHCKLCNYLKFLVCEYLTAGIGGITQNQRLCSLFKSLLQPIPVKGKFGWDKGNINWLCP